MPTYNWKNVVLERPKEKQITDLCEKRASLQTLNRILMGKLLLCELLIWISKGVQGDFFNKKF